MVTPYEVGPAEAVSHAPDFTDRGQGPRSSLDYAD
jgi:hypothetical protein